MIKERDNDAIRDGGGGSVGGREREGGSYGGDNCGSEGGKMVEVKDALVENLR